MTYFHCKVILPKLNEGLNIKIPWITEECWLRIVTNSPRRNKSKRLHASLKDNRWSQGSWIEVLFKRDDQIKTCFSTELIKAQRSNNSLERVETCAVQQREPNLSSRKKTLAQGSGQKHWLPPLMVGTRNPAKKPLSLEVYLMLLVISRLQRYQCTVQMAWHLFGNLGVDVSYLWSLPFNVHGCFSFKKKTRKNGRGGTWEHLLGKFYERGYFPILLIFPMQNKKLTMMMRASHFPSTKSQHSLSTDPNTRFFFWCSLMLRVWNIDLHFGL